MGRRSVVGTRLDKLPSGRFLVSDVVRGPWNREWFDELASAPFSAHDDHADSPAGSATEGA